MDEKHLVLCYTTNHFREWVHDWTPPYDEEGVIVNRRLTNNIFTVQYEHKTIDYMAFTPQMSGDKLRGHRFDKIIDLMALSDNELAFFNMYVRGVNMEYMESKMQDYIEAGINEADRCYARIAELEGLNQVLAATVDALKISDSELHALVEDLIDHLRYNKCESTDVLEVYWDRLDAIQTTQISPQQHLLERDAQKGRDGFMYAFYYKFDRMDDVEVSIAADQYADSILKGEVK